MITSFSSAVFSTSLRMWPVRGKEVRDAFVSRRASLEIGGRARKRDDQKLYVLTLSTNTSMLIIISIISLRHLGVTWVDRGGYGGKITSGYREGIVAVPGIEAVGIGCGYGSSDNSGRCCESCDEFERAHVGPLIIIR